MNERRGNRRVHTAGQPTDDIVVAHLGTNPCDLILDERTRRPIGLGATHTEQKIGDDFSTSRRVRHLGVELYSVYWLRRVTERRQWIAVAGCSRNEALGRGLDVITVTHPHGNLFAFGESVEQHTR